ncbi:acetate/propionate family kinase [Puniceicoccus vermicola]|uniref:Acetate kinase n=1 Tax=Puniceicoccus vermicola TaxID=388746 RepID=A0A7X1B141_9BACT|nr:acetate kinase [Puniceicoccus vermicola]MBC2603534.1 acetate kinase [Puniceicoccus vermicola]
MLVFVANLGSTSFKYSLFSMKGEAPELLARDGYERVTDHAEVIADSLEKLKADGVIQSADDIQGVGFKTVLGGEVTGCIAADDVCLKALEDNSDLAPAHNPPYAAGIRGFQQKLPNATLVALFETAFYQWMPARRRRYAVPEEWAEAGVKRYGFHGASHKFIAERSAELAGYDDLADSIRSLYVNGPSEKGARNFRVISCHLGGSSSVTAMRDGIAQGSSMGMSPQSGLPQNNRVGDLDSMAIPLATKRLGLSMEEIERVLTKESGLLGLSGVSNDIRDIREAAEQGNDRAQLAREFLAGSVRDWVGTYFFTLGGAERIVFTAGIGENDAALRAEVLTGLEDLGIVLDPIKNESGERGERKISADNSKTEVWVIPANEEWVVARETRRFIENNQ